MEVESAFVQSVKQVLAQQGSAFSPRDAPLLSSSKSKLSIAKLPDPHILLRERWEDVTLFGEELA